MTDGLHTHSTNLTAHSPQGGSAARSSDGSAAVCGGGSAETSGQPVAFRFPALAGRKRRQRVGEAFFAAGDAERELLAKQLLLLVTAEEVEAIMRQVRGESDGPGESSASEIDGADGGGEGRIKGNAMAVSSEGTDVGSTGTEAIATREAVMVPPTEPADPSVAVSEESERILNKNAFEEPIRCPIPGCHVVVQGALALDAHHQAMHRAMCATCSKAFPSNRLLNIHVAEAHDSFFQAKVARGLAMYECLVETCSHRFPSDAARHQHLVARHHYPPSFHFHSLSQSHPSQRRRRQMAQHRGEGGGEVGDGGEVRGGERGGMEIATKEFEVEKKGDEAVNAGVRGSKEGLRQVEDTANAVNAAEALDAATRGGGTPASAATETAATVSAAEVLATSAPGSGGMDVDSLAAAVSRLTTSDFVPRSVSFGRRRGRGMMHGSGRGRTGGLRGNKDVAADNVGQ
ncbi:hypothetical protein CLOM_g12517 [Closterium sp. NIES-68]|nr:hypothetical protein CLOM_g12517 [Closterium sp. NIES-68]